MISFIFYFHSKRIDNLSQTLRFLHKREQDIIHQCEIILICQDVYEGDVAGIKPFNMNLAVYNKAKMCNFGVKQAKNEVIALLDSDRILPPKYFQRTYPLVVQDLFVSTHNLLAFPIDYSDEEIDAMDVLTYPDTKSQQCEPFKKNLFSGNTMFLKKDYLVCGGMDEEYVGYGFCDNDMTYNVRKHGMRTLWQDDIELHLYHSAEVCWDGKMCEDDTLRVMTALNVLRFSRKWGQPPIKLSSLLKSNDLKTSPKLLAHDVKNKYGIFFV